MSTTNKTVSHMIALASVAAIVTGCMGGAGSDSSSEELNSREGSSSNSSSSSSKESFSLQCLSRTASIVGFSDTSISLNGNAQVGGAVVLLGRSGLSANGNSRVGDSIYAPSADAVRLKGNASTGELKLEDLTPAEDAVLEAIESIDDASVTQEFDSVAGSKVISGSGGLNVVHVTGDIRLSSNQNLVLKGNAEDSFLITVDGDLSLSGNSRISLQGGAEAHNVLIRLKRSGAQIKMSGNGSAIGTIVAAEGVAQISGNGRLQGAILARQQIVISGNGFTFEPAPFCPFWEPAPSPTPTPTPSPSDDEEEGETGGGDTDPSDGGGTGGGTDPSDDGGSTGSGGGSTPPILGV